MRAAQGKLCWQEAARFGAVYNKDGTDNAINNDVDNGTLCNHSMCTQVIKSKIRLIFNNICEWKLIATTVNTWNLFEKKR